ncbi:MAG: DUF302 domain-containing protein [Chloroflexi bacterium]|nr:DUF302 domain-containing protein [Chloroflexota bacterium]
MKQFEYGLKVSTSLGYDAAVETTVEALKSQGFGVLTEIDVKSTLKKKIDVDFKRYVILGACNPNLAHAALKAEDDLGLLLPCNVIVYEDGEGSVVAVMDPNLMAGVTGNDTLSDVASQARNAMEEVLRQVEAA